MSIWLRLVINEFKPQFGLPKTFYDGTIMPLERFEPDSYLQFVQRYHFFWDFFGVKGTMVHLRRCIYDGQIYSINENTKEEVYNESTVSHAKYHELFNGKYDQYKRRMIRLLMGDMTPMDFRMKMKNKLTEVINKVDRDQMGYVTFINNRMMDLFNLTDT